MPHDVVASRLRSGGIPNYRGWWAGMHHLSTLLPNRQMGRPRFAADRGRFSRHCLGQDQAAAGFCRLSNALFTPRWQAAPSLELVVRPPIAAVPYSLHPQP